MELHVTNSLQQEIAEISILFLDANLIYIFSKSEIPECIVKSVIELIQQLVWMKAEWALKKDNKFNCTHRIIQSMLMFYFK